MGELVERFFDEEADEVRSVLREELRDRTSGSRYFTFNVFNVRLDLDQGVATVEDELDPPKWESVPLDEFRVRLTT